MEPITSGRYYTTKTLIIPICDIPGFSINEFSDIPKLFKIIPEETEFDVVECGPGEFGTLGLCLDLTEDDLPEFLEHCQKF